MNNSNFKTIATSNTDSEHIVIIEKLYKHYGNKTTEVRAVDGIDLQIIKKKFTVLTGPSGCGKTTLMNLLGAIDTPTSGRINIANTNILNLNDRELTYFRTKHIGFIFQSYNLIPVMNVFDNVAYPLLLNKTPQKQVKERVNKILAEVKIDHLIKKKPIHLSGGQQQRVSIARALVNNPSLVLADEPTANLDSKTSSLILELMKNLAAQQNCTFVFSSHDDLVVNYADLVYKMKDGKIVDKQIKN